MYGPGVEKIFDEVQKIFPDNKVEIFSSDYMKKKKQTEALFNKINNNVFIHKLFKYRSYFS